MAHKTQKTRETSPKGKERIYVNMSNDEYKQYVESKAKKSPILKNCLWAFTVGGTICVIGQGLMDFYQYMGMDERHLSTAAAVTLILAAAILTGMGKYDKLAKRAGAGTLVPITGFANAMVSSAMEFRSEGIITGTAAKLFAVAGPVLVFGISASILLGAIQFLCSLV